MKWIKYKDHDWVNVDDIQTIKKDIINDTQLVVKYNKGGVLGWYCDTKEEQDSLYNKIIAVLSEKGLLVDIG